MKTNRKFRRKSLIDKRFQLGVAGTLAAVQLLTFLGALLAASWFYLFVLDRRMVCSHNAAFLNHMGVAGAIAIALLIYWCIRRTHAIAGPIYKTRQLLRAAAGGKFPEQPVRFRKRDFFQDLAKDLNTCLETMRDMQTERQQLQLALEELLESSRSEKQPAEEGRPRLCAIINRIQGGSPE